MLRQDGCELGGLKLGSRTTDIPVQVVAKGHVSISWIACAVQCQSVSSAPSRERPLRLAGGFKTMPHAELLLPIVRGVVLEYQMLGQHGNVKKSTIGETLPLDISLGLPLWPRI